MGRIGSSARGSRARVPAPCIPGSTRGGKSRMSSASTGRFSEEIRASDEVWISDGVWISDECGITDEVRISDAVWSAPDPAVDREGPPKSGADRGTPGRPWFSPLRLSPQDSGIATGRRLTGCIMASLLVSLGMRTNPGPFCVHEPTLPLLGYRDRPREPSRFYNGRLEPKSGRRYRLPCGLLIVNSDAWTWVPLLRPSGS